VNKQTAKIFMSGTAYGFSMLTTAIPQSATDYFRDSWASCNLYFPRFVAVSGWG